jgi:phage recombination protein Bet
MTEIATRPGAIDRPVLFTAEQVALIKRQLLQPRDRQATDDELALFLYQCERTKLDPFNRQIYAVFRWDARIKAERMTVQVSIDGLRLVAERTGKYQGQHGPYWTVDAKEWVDVWIAVEPPAAAKVGVWKEGAREPTFGVALFREYSVKDSQGRLTPFWRNMPANQIAKCAEALALRKAFPQETSGLYTTEEMAQADAPEPPSIESFAASLPESTPATVEPPTQGDESPERVTFPRQTLDDRLKNDGAESMGLVENEAPAPAANRKLDETINADELGALRALIEQADVSASFVRMDLMGQGIEDVGEIEDVLPRLTVGQAFHVMDAIRKKP